MSIINKILSEIEKNKEKTILNENKPMELQLGSAFNRYKNRLPNILILIIILVVIVITGALLIHKNAVKIKNHSSSQESVAVSEKTTLATTQKPEAALYKKAIPHEELAELKNINISVSNNKTLVNFVLSHETYYYVEHEQDPQQLKLILGNTNYTVEPNVNVTNTVIKSLTTHKVNNNTEIDLNLSANSQIIGLQFYNQPQTQLQLTLLNTNTPTATISKTEVSSTLSQQHVTPHYDDAIQLINAGKIKEAIKKLYNIIESSPADEQTYELLATLLTKDNQLNSANEILTTARKLFPDNSRFLQLQAYVLAKKGQTSQALQLLNKNLPPVQQNPEYYALIASLYQQKGEFMPAAQIYHQLLEIYPDQARWWLGLGVALESANKQYAAEEAYRKAAALGNLSPQAQDFLNNKLYNK